MPPGILIVVPAYNERQSISGVINDLTSHGYKNILVVDDGSSDNTAKAIPKNRVFLVHHIVNRGLGAALGTGFAYGREHGVEILVTFDADGQHKALDIQKVITPIKKGQADVVVGSRFRWQKGTIPFDRLILNHLSNIATRFLYGVNSTDTQSGLRAFNKKAIETIEIKTQRMEVSNEFFREIKKNKLRYFEIPIKPIYTPYSLAGSSQERGAVVKFASRMILRLFR